MLRDWAWFLPALLPSHSLQFGAVQGCCWGRRGSNALPRGFRVRDALAWPWHTRQAQKCLQRRQTLVPCSSSGGGPRGCLSGSLMPNTSLTHPQHRSVSHQRQSARPAGLCPGCRVPRSHEPVLDTASAGLGASAGW